MFINHSLMYNYDHGSRKPLGILSNHKFLDSLININIAN